jgi:hypothetical protein
MLKDKLNIFWLGNKQLRLELNPEASQVARKDNFDLN